MHEGLLRRASGRACADAGASRAAGAAAADQATRSWGTPAAETLFDAPVTILGGGGITESLLKLLAPFRVRATVLRRSAEPVPGAARTLPMSELTQALSDARVVFLALALTPQTEHVIGAEQLAAMRPGSWLVNVARGRHVDTASAGGRADARADRWRRPGRHRPGAAAGRASALGSGELHHHPAYGGHAGNGQADAGQADQRQRGQVRSRGAAARRRRRRGRLLQPARQY